tara:strand:- start:81 stop:200 length:120 start_codon:yes stop_codon:yes gene_type:complete
MNELFELWMELFKIGLTLEEISDKLDLEIEYINMCSKET